MGRFTPQLTTDQVQAICQASLDQGMSYDRIAAAARGGQLPKVGAFKVSISSIGNYVRAERRARMAVAIREDGTDGNTAMARVIVAEELGRLATQKRRGLEDLKRLRELVAIDKALASPAQRRQTHQNGNTENGDAQPSELVAGMLGTEHGGEARSATPATSHGEGDT